MKRDIEGVVIQRPRVCFVGYRHIRELAMPAIGEYTGQADFELVDGSFEGALSLARQRMDQGAVDAFLSAGANGAVLRQGLRAPVATIQLTGFDLLQALIRAKRTTDRVGVVTFGEVIPELDSVKSLLNIEIRQHAYRTQEDAQQCFRRLRDEGFTTIVGSSLVVELAETHGLAGILAYSVDSIRRGIEEAIELARIARLEASQYEQLNGVLRSLEDAVLAVDDAHRIVAVNPPMQRLLGAPQSNLMGRPLEQVAPELSLRDALARGSDGQATVQRFEQRDWWARRTLIEAGGSTVGAILVLRESLEARTVPTPTRTPQQRPRSTARHRFASLVGNSMAMRRAIRTAQRYARTDLTVLLSGETGTGKELFAQSIHNDSGRALQPFIAVNCAALPESLLESELFGYEEGAFTGARRGGRRGLIEAAHKGTLFLDEIGDMPLLLQSRLLRVLQEREVTRLGASASIPVDLRIIAATHCPLEERVRSGHFRHDLFYRLNALRLTLPSLRDRREDIEPLALAILGQRLARLGLAGAEHEVLKPLRRLIGGYPWPGNVRELENVCERLAALHAGDDPDLLAGELPMEFPEFFTTPQRASASEAANGPRCDPAGPWAQRVRQAMARNGNNRQAAARELGISRSTLWRWLQRAQPTEP